MASIQNHIKEEPNSPKKGIILDMAMAKLLFGKESPNEIIAQGQNIVKIGDLGKNFTSLRKLDISFNPLRSLYNIDQLVQLRHLSAYSCQITNLDDIKQVKHLESLMLQQNGVAAIPIFFSSLHKLKELRFDRNKLLTIDNLSCCSSLRTLDISYNSISSLDGIAGLQSLQEFRATNNKITSLKPLRALPSLIELDVAYNELKNLDGLQNLPTLLTLHAENNKINTCSIPQTYSRGTKSLTKLDSETAKDDKKIIKQTSKTSLSGKEEKKDETKLEEVLGMPVLTEVYLSNNNLKTLSGLDRLGISVEFLDISNNNIDDYETSLTPFLLYLKKVTEIKLLGNSFISNGEIEGGSKKSWTESSKKDEVLEKIFLSVLPNCPNLKLIDGMVLKTKKGVEEGKDVYYITEDDTNDQEFDANVILTSPLKKNKLKDNGSDNEDNSDEKNDTENDHNMGQNAPTINLKNMYTMEELQIMEKAYRDLLNDSREILSSVFMIPLEDSVSQFGPRNIIAPTLKSILKKKKEEQSGIKKEVGKKVLIGSPTKNIIHSIENISDVIKNDALVIDNNETDLSKMKEKDDDNVSIQSKESSSSNVPGVTFLSDMGAKITSDNKKKPIEKKNFEDNMSQETFEELLYSKPTKKVVSDSTIKMYGGSGLSRHGSKIRSITGVSKENNILNSPTSNPFANESPLAIDSSMPVLAPKIVFKPPLEFDSSALLNLIHAEKDKGNALNAPFIASKSEQLSKIDEESEHKRETIYDSDIVSNIIKDIQRKKEEDSSLFLTSSTKQETLDLVSSLTVLALNSTPSSSSRPKSGKSVGYDSRINTPRDFNSEYDMSINLDSFSINNNMTRENSAAPSGRKTPLYRRTKSEPAVLSPRNGEESDNNNANSPAQRPSSNPNTSRQDMIDDELSDDDNYSEAVNILDPNLEYDDEEEYLVVSPRYTPHSLANKAQHPDTISPRPTPGMPLFVMTGNKISPGTKLKQDKKTMKFKMPLVLDDMNESDLLSLEGSVLSTRK